MKVKIGKYIDNTTSDIHTKHMNKKYGHQWVPEKLYDNEDWFYLWIENIVDVFYDCTINLVKRFMKRTVKVRIDPWDTWSMDFTLTPIILPMLIQLKKTKHGTPMVDNEDVPEELRTDELDHEKFQKRWDWVMDEMIWAFEQIEKDRIDQSDEAYQDRVIRGTTLFGKYFQSLWD